MKVPITIRLLRPTGWRTRRAQFRAWLSIKVKRGGERLSWWLWPS